jgi:hypothetical protein
MSAAGSMAPGVLGNLPTWHRRLLTYWGISLLILLSGCGQPHDPDPIKGTGNMPTPTQNQQVERPLLDQPVSSTIATATFALG